MPRGQRTTIEEVVLVEIGSVAMPHEPGSSGLSGLIYREVITWAHKYAYEGSGKMPSC